LQLLQVRLGALVIFVSFAIGWTNNPWFFLIPLIFAAVMLVPFFPFVSARKALYTAKTTANPKLALAQQPLESPTAQSWPPCSDSRRLSERAANSIRTGRKTA
jgi:hypothetical protein